MQALTLIDFISLLSSIASLILAIVAIIAARTSEKEVRDNFQNTQKMLIEYENRMKEVLSEIDKKSSIIEKTVSESQKELMTTMMNIINETVIPKKNDMGEEFAMMFMQNIMKDPSQATQIMNSLKPFIDHNKNK